MNPVTAWAKERESIRLKKEAGLPPPWSEDSVFQQFRFCNVRREDDKVTRWIAHNWRTPNADDPDLWFAMTVARHLNLPETLFELGYPVPWKPKRFIEVIRARRSRGMTAFNAAYMIRAGKSKEDKAAYLAEEVLGQLWRNRKQVRPVTGDALASFHARLQAQFGLGSFMSAQTVADVKYVGVLAKAVDWWDFAASGPGSRRGLNRVLGREVKAPWKEADWREELAKLRKVLEPEFAEHGLPWSHAQDSQNQLCETDKSLRYKAGDGRPKQRYRGGQPSVFTAG